MNLVEYLKIRKKIDDRELNINDMSDDERKGFLETLKQLIISKREGTEFDDGEDRVYYDPMRILEKECMYNIIFGARGPGKSWAFRYMLLWEAYTDCDYYTFRKTGEMVPIKKKRSQFCYVRRSELEIAPNKVLEWFRKFVLLEDDDGLNMIEKITQGEYCGVDAYAGHFYFYNYNDKGKKVRGKEIGCYKSISQGGSQSKSLDEPLVRNLILEEFMNKDGNYVDEETYKLKQLIKTIKREESDFKVFMLSNAEDMDCIYFDDFGIPDARNIGLDECRVFTAPNGVEVAVERPVLKGKADITIGMKGDAMMNSGEWVVDEHPHLPLSKEGKKRKIKDFEIIYRIAYKYMSHVFWIYLLVDPENGFPFLFVDKIWSYADYGMPRDKNIRIITDEFNYHPWASDHLCSLTKYDDKVIELYNLGRICFANNKIGTEFSGVVNQKGSL